MKSRHLKIVLGLAMIATVSTVNSFSLLTESVVYRGFETCFITHIHSGPFSMENPSLAIPVVSLDANSPRFRRNAKKLEKQWLSRRQSCDVKYIWYPRTKAEIYGVVKEFSWITTCTSVYSDLEEGGIDCYKYVYYIYVLQEKPLGKRREEMDWVDKTNNPLPIYEMVLKNNSVEILVNLEQPCTNILKQNLSYPEFQKKYGRELLAEQYSNFVRFGGCDWKVSVFKDTSYAIEHPSMENHPLMHYKYFPVFKYFFLLFKSYRRSVLPENIEFVGDKSEAETELYCYPERTLDAGSGLSRFLRKIFADDFIIEEAAYNFITCDGIQERLFMFEAYSSPFNLGVWLFLLASLTTSFLVVRFVSKSDLYFFGLRVLSRQDVGIPLKLRNATWFTVFFTTQLLAYNTVTNLYEMYVTTDLAAPLPKSKLELVGEAVIGKGFSAFSFVSTIEMITNTYFVEHGISTILEGYLKTEKLEEKEDLTAGDNIINRLVKNLLENVNKVVLVEPTLENYEERVEQLLECSKTILVDKHSRLVEVYIDAHRKKPNSNLYFGKDSFFHPALMLQVVDKRWDRNDLIRSRLHYFIQSGLLQFYREKSRIREDIQLEKIKLSKRFEIAPLDLKGNIASVFVIFGVLLVSSLIVFSAEFLKGLWSFGKIFLPALVKTLRSKCSRSKELKKRRRCCCKRTDEGS